MSGEGEASGSQGPSGSASFLPWHLIPSFDPGETDLSDYTRRLEFLAGIWPADQLQHLAPRAALMCKGSAFQKVLRLDPEKLKVKTPDGVKLIVTTLGGVWGKTVLENKYEKFEKAIYGISQRQDESNDSYLARHEILFEDLITQGAALAEMRAYILLRNSTLSSDDKKKVLVESKGDLKYDTVTTAIRMLGSKFFQDVQGNQKIGKTKTYDVNHVQEQDEETFFEDTSHAFLLDHGDLPDVMVDQFIQEGDEDALVVQQFEEALIDTIQNDQEMTAYMNAYVEARKRLTEKTKSRGFWPVRAKGSGKKGKGKSLFMRSRKPLALRIAESECRLCGVRGHWKAECPKRLANSASVPKAQPASAMVSVTDTCDDEADVFVMESIPASCVPSSHAAQVPQGFGLSHSHNCCVCWGHKGYKNHETYYNQVKGRMQVLLKTIKHPFDRQRAPEPPLNNPSPKTMPGSVSCDNPMSLRSVHVHMENAKQQESEKHPTVEQPVETAMFATASTVGILDLGASQTVMGRHQVPEFLSNLPQEIRELVFEQPVQMSFRFGNNSIVPCHHAMFVPVDKFWIKIAIVESRTPFLISNNVCRSLGAVIDTIEQKIHFKQLGCTLPLSLSGKKLFLLDVCDLIAQKPPRSVESLEKAVNLSDRILMCQAQEPPKSSEAIPVTASSCPDRANPTMKHEHSPVSHEQFFQTPSKLESVRADTSQCVQPVLAEEIHPQTASSEFLQSTAVSSSHVHEPASRSLCCSEVQAGPIREDGRTQSNELCTAISDDHQVRRGQDRKDVRRGPQDRSPILPMVPEEVCSERKAGTHGICPLPGLVCGTSGADAGERWVTKSPATSSQSQGQIGRSDAHVLRGLSDRSGRGRSVGYPDGPKIAADGGPQQPALGSSRRCTEPTDGPNPESDVPGLHSGIPRAASSIETLLLEQCVNEYNAFVKTMNCEICQHAHDVNPILQEMREFFFQHGFDPCAHHQPRLDVLEVYCSCESQLTNQCLRQGLRAKRFCLQDGDLSEQSGRYKLYDVLMKQRPRHIWTAPRCKAWCKWSQFNAGRSIAMAEQVMQARDDDQVHLQLCDALFQHQVSSGPAFHYHLEQPQGSHMVLQEPLQSIVNQSIRATCDMCTAGKLKNPETNHFLKKGTQIFTSSAIVARCLEQLTCNHQHQHSPVAGSFKGSDGHHHKVSEFSELYTQTFGIKMARAIQASKTSSETAKHVHQETILGVDDENPRPESEMKRRRLNAKTSNPPGYDDDASVSDSQGSQSVQVEKQPDDHVEDVKVDWSQILQQALHEAPRVGSLVLEKGGLFDCIQKACPDHQIRVIELCKGTDRFRKPPAKLAKHEAPWRMTFGLHRHSLEPFEPTPWVNWESMSNRQMCSAAPPARILVSVFARPIDKPDQKDEISDLSQDRKHEMQSSFDQQNKRFKSAHDSSAVPAPSDSITVSTDPSEAELMPKEETNLKRAVEQLAESTVQHGPKYLSLKPAVRQWISKIHHNLGHPNSQKLKNVLAQQGYAPEILQGVDDFRCSTCHEVQGPRISRPAAISEIREFNDSIGCDLITWTSPQSHKQFQFLHVIDAATNFQTAIPVFRTDAKSLYEALQDCWFHWAGPCRQLVTDNASGICSEEFIQIAQGLDVHLRIVAAFAHWQLGRTERHGDILQHMLEKFDHDHVIDNHEQFKNALRECCNAKNSLSRFRGYTPEILVLGKAQKLPGNLSEDVGTASQYLADVETPEGIAFRADLAKRESARLAFIHADHSEKLRRAFLRRQRPHRGHFSSGAFVMFWRPGRGEYPGQWHGPARVIVQEADHVIWISHASRVYRVAPEHVRVLSEREASNQLDAMDKCDLPMPPKESGKGVFQYEDLTGIPAVMPDNDPVMPNNPNPVNPPSISIAADHQPDSEPSMPPPSIQSNEYTPTTPLSNMPDETPDSTAINNPIEIPVPVPDSSDDDLVLEDAWICQNDKVIRVHHKPRNSAFDPSTCSDCPVDLLSISGERTTSGNSPGQSVWTYRDQWGADDHQWSTKHSWTGVTIFTVIQEEHAHHAVEIEDIMHVEQGQVFECEIFLSETECLQICEDPYQLPVLAAAAAKRQRTEVKLKDLTQAEQVDFQKAKEKKINQWLDTETVRRILRSRIPDKNILRCRWVLTWKELDSIEAQAEGKARKPKARLVVLGYEDPDLTEIPRDSPTLQKESRSLLLQLCASRKWCIRSFDIKTAFLRGSRRDNRVLGLDPPPELRAKMGLKETEICELLKSAYGLVNAPFLWYSEMKDYLLYLGFVMSPLDPCVFVLADQQGHLHEAIGTHVDDGLCFGDSVFDAALTQLESRYPFGAKREKDFVFTGIHIFQDDQYNIHLDQTEYIRNIEPISIDRSRRKQEQLEVTEGERQGLRGLIGSLQYAASNSRPDISARLSFLQSKINCAKIHDLLEANRLLGDAQKHAHIGVTISSIPDDEIRMVAYSDASFATREKQQSQKGALFLAVHQDVFGQKKALSSPLTWYSKKIERVVASTLASETFALSSAVDLLNWLRLAWSWLRNPNIPWQTPEKVWLSEPPSIAVVDCKSLYDVISKNTTPQCQEHRTLIEALVIKENIQQGIKPHWVHSAAQLADALTKVMDPYQLREFLKNKYCCLHDVQEILKQRADKKAQKTWLSTATTDNPDECQNGTTLQWPAWG